VQRLCKSISVALLVILVRFDGQAQTTAQGDIFDSGGGGAPADGDVFDSGGRGAPGNPGRCDPRSPTYRCCMMWQTIPTDSRTIQYGLPIWVKIGGPLWNHISCSVAAGNDCYGGYMLCWGPKHFAPTNGNVPAPSPSSAYTDGLLKGLDSCVKAINNAAAAVEAMKRNDFRTAARLLGAQGQSVGLRAIYQIYQDVTGTNQIGISPYESGRIAGTRICNYFIIPEVSGRVGGAIGKVGKGAPPRVSPSGSNPGPPLREPPPPAGPQQPPVRSAPQPTPTSAPPRLGAPPREPPQPAGPQQPPVRPAPQPPRSGAPPRDQPQPAGPQQPPGRPQPQPVPKPNPGGPPTGTQPSPPRPQPNPGGPPTVTQPSPPRPQPNPGGPPTGTQPSPPRPQPNPAPNPRPGPITPPSGIQQFPPPQGSSAAKPKPDAQSPQQ
jgi:hypothetical protein